MDNDENSKNQWLGNYVFSGNPWFIQKQNVMNDYDLVISASVMPPTKSDWVTHLKIDMSQKDRVLSTQKHRSFAIAMAIPP